MHGLPKVLQTRADIENVTEMAKLGQLPKAGAQKLMEAIQNRATLKAPIVSAVGVNVTVMYLPEAQISGQGNGITITAIEHHEGEDGPETTTLTLASALPDGTAAVEIASPVDMYAEVGTTADEIETAKEELL
jgi:hypothetical protein